MNLISAEILPQAKLFQGASLLGSKHVLFNGVYSQERVVRTGACHEINRRYWKSQLFLRAKVFLHLQQHQQREVFFSFLP